MGVLRAGLDWPPRDLKQAPNATCTIAGFLERRLRPTTLLTLTPRAGSGLQPDVLATFPATCA